MSVLLRGLLTPLPPSEAEYPAAMALPDEERTRATERLLTRADHARRRGLTLRVLRHLAASAVFLAGAATEDARDHRAGLAALSGVWLGQAALLLVSALARSPSLERFVLGQRPRTRFGQPP